jgi:hypothetical protein
MFVLLLQCSVKGWCRDTGIDTIVLMIDDFKQVPERESSRLDSERSYKSRPTDANEYMLPKPQKVTRPTPGFRTPEQVAAESAARDKVTSDSPTGMLAAGDQELLLPEHGTPDAATEGAGPTGADAKKAGPPATITLFRRWTVPRKKFFIITAAAVLVLAAGGTAFAMTHHDEPKPVAKAKAVAKPAPKPIVSPLTGMVVTPEQRDLPVTGVMIENSPDARPQSGLKDAGVVYEAIAEAGITRFLALYQEAQPDNIGPVRSSRPYYLDWAMAFDAGYAHVGGSPDALQRIKDINVKDLDQFYNPAAYHRITTRYAPHNMYSGVNQLTDLAKSKGWDKSTFTPFVRKAEQPYKAPAPAAAPAGSKGKQPAGDSRKPANSINFGISGAYYNAHYDYDPTVNNYKRVMGGAAHIDANSNTQITPRVVIALAMPYSLMSDGYHSSYNTIGSGKMFVFQDGTVTTGTWSKGQPKEQFVFKDDAGKTLALDPGQTWISVVGDPAAVTYQ